MAVGNKKISIMCFITVSVLLYCSGDQDYSSCEYFRQETAEFQNDNEIMFGTDMNGVANPIVTTFDTWPVSQ